MADNFLSQLPAQATVAFNKPVSSRQAGSGLVYRRSSGVSLWSGQIFNAPQTHPDLLGELQALSEYDSWFFADLHTAGGPNAQTAPITRPASHWDENGVFHSERLPASIGPPAWTENPSDLPQYPRDPGGHTAFTIDNVVFQNHFFIPADNRFLKNVKRGHILSFRPARSVLRDHVTARVVTKVELMQLAISRYNGVLGYRNFLKISFSDLSTEYFPNFPDPAQLQVCANRPHVRAVVVSNPTSWSTVPYAMRVNGYDWVEDAMSRLGIAKDLIAPLRLSGGTLENPRVLRLSGGSDADPWVLVVKQ